MFDLCKTVHRPAKSDAYGSAQHEGPWWTIKNGRISAGEGTPLIRA